MIDRVLQAVDGRREPALAGLKQFLSIPSVSTKPEHKPDMLRCAEWLSGQLRECGLTVEILPTGGHPAVVAKTSHKPGQPTVILYGHYDVQPPEPLEEWISPPFEPTLRKNEAGFDAIYARGAVDDKGQVWCHVEALRAWQQVGGPPLNVTLLIEGEEEIGSDHLPGFVRQYKEKLQADIALVSDTNQFARGVPAITYGLRGLVYMEVFLTAASHDLHSGMFGGAVPNPANILCQLLGGLHDFQGRVTLPGFYDDVTPLTDAERAGYAGLPFDSKEFADSLRLPDADLFGERGFTSIERRWARPTLDINGITSGYQGPGAKTVIPSKASAKVSMRLVPHQDPAKIQASFEKTLRERCPVGVKIEFARHGASPAALVRHDSPAIAVASKAVERGFGTPPVLVREGGSIPIVGLLKDVLGVDTLLVGFGLPDDRIHSPNEKFDLDAFYAGIRTAAALYDELSKFKA